MSIKALREERAKLVSDARALVNDNGPSAEIDAKFDAMMAGADAIKARIDRLERLNEEEANLAELSAQSASLRNISVEQVEEEKKEVNRAFGNYLRNGLDRISGEDRIIMNRRFQNAAGEGTGTGGGFTVAQDFYHKIIDAQKAYGGMFDCGATVIDSSMGNPLPVPTDNDVNNMGSIIGENTAMSDGPDINFGQIILNAYMYTSKPVKVSLQLLQDSAFDIEAWLTQKLGIRLARIVNNHLTVGDGNGKPNGVLTAATAANTGIAGETTSIIWDNLIDLEHAVDPAYRRNATYMMSDQALKMVKKLKDTQNRPLWLPGVALKEPDTINGYGYVINQDLPVPAANAKSIMFGDFSNYLIRRVAGSHIIRLTERYADVGQVAFILFQRWDGALADAGTHPIGYFSQSAT